MRVVGIGLARGQRTRLAAAVGPDVEFVEAGPGAARLVRELRPDALILGLGGPTGRLAGLVAECRALGIRVLVAPPSPDGARSASTEAAATLRLAALLRGDAGRRP